MTYDCFGNATPGIPPSIADDFASIDRYRPIPVTRRLDYNDARVTAMIGTGDARVAWDMYHAMNDELRGDS